MPVECVYFGYAFLSSVERLEIPKTQMKKDTWNQQKKVQQRFPENASIFKAITTISPKEVSGVQVLTKLTKCFKNISPDIDSVNKELCQMKSIDVPKDMSDHLVQYKDAAANPLFYFVPDLALILYSLPYSYAEVELIISKMNYFKNKLRNKMARPTTDALICIDGSLQWREENCYNFRFSNRKTKKFNAETLYKLNLESRLHSLQNVCGRLFLWLKYARLRLAP